MSISSIVQQAQALSGRIKDLDSLGSALLVEAESNNRLVESLRKFQDDMDSLNRITNSKSNTDMVNRIQQQNANSSEILKENRELKACLEDYERAMEMIMQKYREHASSKVLETQTNLKDVYNEKLWKVIRDQREKINEMAAVMHHAASVDDAAINRYIEIMSNLQKENQTLRELLQISKQFGSANRPIRSNELFMDEKSVQTDGDDSADELSISGASVENANNNTVIHMSTSNCSTATDGVSPVPENISVGDNNNQPAVNADAIKVNGLKEDDLTTTTTTATATKTTNSIETDTASKNNKLPSGTCTKNIDNFVGDIPT